METEGTCLRAFLGLRMTKQALQARFGIGLIQAQVGRPVSVAYTDVIHTLEAYRDGSFSLQGG